MRLGKGVKTASPNTTYDNMGSRSTFKVSSYTQVEPEMVGAETRSIVGQEDISLRKQSKGERPPLVGQASSSSNDSVSLSFEGNNSDTEKENVVRYQPGIVESYVDTVHMDAGLGGINFTRGSYVSTPYVGMLNRDEYINQRPPEGSSDQILGTNQPQENTQDLPRIRSTSSASSVTSSKPLEWDSGADVGYNQIEINTGISQNPGMSTIERIALACRTNLLTRSDPEGTTGPTGQQQPNLFMPMIQTKVSLKNKLGSPNAESTPVFTSDISPETVSSDVISPILFNFGQKFDNATSNSSSKSDVGDNTERNKIQDNDCMSVSSGSKKRSKIPLFPEIIESLPKSSQPNKGRYDNLGNKYQSLSNSDDKSSEASDSQRFKVQNNKRLHGIFDTEPRSLVLSNQSFESKADIDISASSRSITSNKKISSSLENIPTANNEPENVKYSNSLPRSRSQSNLQHDKLGLEATDSVISNNSPKYNMALHNLIQNNKSASSSSIATVVQRKGGSPKHKFAQTSTFMQESVAVQVSQCWAGGDFTEFKTATEMHFNETPHLPKNKTVMGDNYHKSNYFNNEVSNNDRIPSDELVLLYQRTKPNEENKLKGDCLTHTHLGVPCTGAHRKVATTNERACPTEVKTVQNPNRAPGEVLRFNTLNQQNRPVTQGSASVDNKLVGGTSTIESVESSAKSGGGWADKQYSVMVEDRVNSFEYLPGHVYENSERQQPVDSHGTSSISIQNQTSNNDTEDARAKTWDSSASSDLEKDVQRGIEIISDFVKGSCANDSIMKKKLIRRVVEKLITKNYNEDSVRPGDLAGNMPWVPSRPPNPVERNGRETRRSLSRSKVPCEFSSRSEKSGSTNASSECFIPRPAASSTFLPNSFREISGGQGKQSHSSTSEISFEKSSKVHGKPTNPMDPKAQAIRKASLPQNLSEESSKSSERGNWREPVTRSEQLIEERRKLMNKSKDKTAVSSSEQSDGATLVQYLNMERENQLFWIRSEIQHLSNLKELLEKQEELKRGMKGLKVKKNKSPAKSVLRDKNHDRVNVNKEESSRPISQTSGGQEKLRGRRPALGVWLEESFTGANKNQSPPSDAGMEDWTSHHYNNENKVNLKSCIKRKSKHSKKTERKMHSVENIESEIYDEAEGQSFRRTAREENKNKPPPTPHWPNGVRLDDNAFVTAEGLMKKNAQTETLDTVGVQTTDSVQQLPIVHPSWFNKQRPKCRCTCRGACQCCANAKAREEEQKKAPVGYYITFEPSPRDRVEPTGAPRSLEEVRIPIPMSEPKQKKSKQRTNDEEGERLMREPEGRNEMDGREERRERAGADRGRTGSETESDSSESGAPLNSAPIYKGGTGMLQYCLLRNRPDYVSRAEDRRQCIAQMQYLRELRDHSKRRLLALTEPMVPPPLQPQLPMPCVRRVFSQQTMRKQTEKKYKQLAEVQKRQHDTKRKESYRTNRLMAEIFNKKLQKRVLKGEIYLSNSLTVLSSV